MNLELSGKNAVITGASKGIGKSIAMTLASEAANIAICARQEDALRATEKEILEKRVKVYAAICDVGNHKALNEFLEAAKINLGNIDILVNNVSALNFGDDSTDWEASINLDLMAGVRATHRRSFHG